MSARGSVGACRTQPDMTGPPDKTVRVGFPAVCDSMVRKLRVPGGRRPGRSNGRVAGSHDPDGAASRAALAGASAVMGSVLPSSGQLPGLGGTVRMLLRGHESQGWSGVPGRLRLLQPPDELVQALLDVPA